MADQRKRRSNDRSRGNSKKDSKWYKEAEASKKWLEDHQNQLLQFYRKDSQNQNLEQVQAYIGHLKKYIYGPEGKAMTASQLRNIYDKIRRKKDPIALQLVRPLLAYAAARQGSKEAKAFVEWLDSLVALVQDEDDVKSFQLFMEAILSYHKFYHPKSQ